MAKPTAARKPAATRQSNIELLRILAMLGVVILHYNSGGGFDSVAMGSAAGFLLYGLEGFFICAVNLFVLITGYFSCTSQKRSLGKLLSLVFQVMVFQELSYAVSLLEGAAFSWRTVLTSLIPNNYFVSLYCALYLLSPYINLLLHRLSQKQLSRLVILCICLFSLWPVITESMDALMWEEFYGVSTISLSGSGKGYSIVNFVLMYLIGAYLRLTDLSIKKRYSSALFVLTGLVLSVWGYGTDITGMARAYCNPLVIAQAVTAFLFFKQLQVRSGIINALAGSAFTCFLLHPMLLKYFHISQAVQRPVLQVGLHVLFTASCIYLLSWPVYALYRSITAPLFSLFDRVGAKRFAELPGFDPQDT